MFGKCSGTGAILGIAFLLAGCETIFGPEISVTIVAPATDTLFEAVPDTASALVATATSTENGNVDGYWLVDGQRHEGLNIQVVLPSGVYELCAVGVSPSGKEGRECREITKRAAAKVYAETLGEGDPDQLTLWLEDTEVGFRVEGEELVASMSTRDLVAPTQEVKVGGDTWQYNSTRHNLRELRAGVTVYVSARNWRIQNDWGGECVNEGALAPISAVLGFKPAPNQGIALLSLNAVHDDPPRVGTWAQESLPIPVVLDTTVHGGDFDSKDLEQLDYFVAEFNKHFCGEWLKAGGMAEPEEGYIHVKIDPSIGERGARAGPYQRSADWIIQGQVRIGSAPVWQQTGSMIHEVLHAMGFGHPAEELRPSIMSSGNAYHARPSLTDITYFQWKHAAVWSGGNEALWSSLRGERLYAN